MEVFFWHRVQDMIWTSLLKFSQLTLSIAKCQKHYKWQWLSLMIHKTKVNPKITMDKYRMVKVHLFHPALQEWTMIRTLLISRVWWQEISMGATSTILQWKSGTKPFPRQPRPQLLWLFRWNLKQSQQF